MNRSGHSRSARAFTLLEALVAVAVFAIVLAAINSVFWTALKLRNKAADAVDSALPLEQALAIIRNDLANIVPPGGSFFGQLQTTFGNTNTTAVNAMLPVSTLPGQNSPAFYTSSGIVDDSTMWGDIQKVYYQLQDSTNNAAAGRDLYRAATRNLLPALQVEVEEQPILSGVENIYFYYHDGQQWQESWDSTTEALKLPRAIKVQIALAQEQRGRLAPPPIEIVVPLLDAGTNNFEQATQ